MQFLGKHQIPAQRVQNMLPGTYSMRISDQQLTTIHGGPHNVWHQPVSGPISSANYIASARRGDGGL
jgi:hypothetical protein